MEIDNEYLHRFFPDTGYENAFDLICKFADTSNTDRSYFGYIEKIFRFSKQPRPVKTVALCNVKLNNGGIERVLSLLSAGLAELENGTKYNIIIATDEEPAANDYDLSPLVSRYILPAYDPEKNNYRERGNALLELIDKQQIDAFVFSSYAAPGLLWDLLTIKSSTRNPAFFIHLHNYFPSIFAIPRQNIDLVWQAFSAADGIITLSDADRKICQNLNKKTYKIINPCLTNQADKKNQWKDGTHHILWIGRISQQKQPLEIVKIMKHVTEELPDAVCHVVGSDDDALMVLLKKSISENKLDNRIILEGFHKSVDDFYQNADVFISTSSFEGFPSTYMESASYGIPSVTYDIPWLEYYNIIDGWEKVPQYDEKAAAKAIISLLRNKSYWEERSRRIYESFLKYRAHNTAEDWTEVFDNYEKGITPPQYEMSSAEYAEVLNQIAFFHARSLEFIDEIYKSSSYRVGNKLIKPLHALKKLKKKLNG